MKRSVEIAGHRTSLTLEPEFWDALKEIAAARGVSINKLVAEIDVARTRGADPPNLSSAIRVFVLHSLRNQTAADPPELPLDAS